MMERRWLPALALFAMAGAAPLSAQVQEWQNQWFWGVKGGGMVYSLPTSGQGFNAAVGGEWMITARRTALYLGYTQTVGVSQADTFAFTGVSGAVPIGFDGMRRIQIAVLVIPTNGVFQPYAGGGFTIETLPNAGLASTVVPAVQTIVDRDLPDRTSGGFSLVMAGVQFRFRKFAAFGQVQVSPQGRDFLLRGSSTLIEFGLRYALTGAREDDVTTRR